MSSQPARNNPAPIIVKKITIVESGHHGGAWKVAYADFVTAMMAFFLLLWLLGSTSEDQRKGLADYFTPTLVKTKEESAGSNGLLGGSSLTDVDSYPHAAGQTGTKALTIPRDATGGPKEGGATIKRIRERVSEALVGKKRLQELMRQVRLINTSAGTRIDLVDDADFSMFALGTTVLTPDARGLLDVVSKAIHSEDGKITVRGHTDSLQYRDPRLANNWSLSAGRAEATRQMLIRQGIGSDRFRRIEGVADTEPVIAGDLTDPRNRRISILLEH